MTMRVLKKNARISNPTSGRTYRVVRPLGEGGFGRAYEAIEVGAHDLELGSRCLKITDEPLSWHREAYYGELLRGQVGAIQLEESFVRERRTWYGPALDYYLVSEFADGGDLARHLEQKGRQRWTTHKVRTEVTKLLRLLAVLHAAGIAHRDLTPHNVFLVNGRLKIGDWGIARGGLASTLAVLDGRNDRFTPPNFRGIPRDDTWMAGQLIAMLLSPDAIRPRTPHEIEREAWDPDLKRVVLRAIGPTRRRYTDAHAMLTDLDKRAHDSRRLTTLHGKNVCFTGRLKILRRDAAALVRQQGGFVQTEVSRSTDVLVRGPAANYVLGNEGRKLIAAHMFGVRIIDEARLRSLLKMRR